MSRHVKFDRNVVDWHLQMTLKCVESRKHVEENIERWKFIILRTGGTVQSYRECAKKCADFSAKKLEQVHKSSTCDE